MSTIEKMTTNDECIQSVVERWESETSLAERWMVLQVHLDEYERLQYLLSECNFKLGDAYITVTQLARLIGEKNGHSEEFLDKFQRQLLEHIWSTIGRPPLQPALPIASHLIEEEKSTESSHLQNGECTSPQIIQVAQPLTSMNGEISNEN